MITKSFYVFLLCCIFSANAKAYSYMNFGDGLESCGTWTVDRHNNEALDDQQWILGFIVGEEYLLGSALKKSVTVNTDANGVFGWTDNYCASNPTSTLSDAGSEFLNDSKTIQFSN